MIPETYEKLQKAVLYCQIYNEFQRRCDDVDARINAIEDKFAKDKEEATTAWRWARNIGKVVFIICAVYCVLCLMIIMRDKLSFEEIFAEIFPIMFIGILSFTAWIIGKRKFEKLENYFQNIYDKELKPQLDELDKEGYGLLDKLKEFDANNSHYITWLPMNYRNQQAIGYLFLVIDSGRAETLKEAYNLYEEQLHRWKMEELAQQSVEAQEYAALAIEQLNRKQEETNAHLQAIEFIQYMQYLDNKNKQ